MGDSREKRIREGDSPTGNAVSGCADDARGFRQVMEAMPLPVLLLRLNGDILEANRLAHEALRVPPGQLVGRSAHSFCPEHDERISWLCRSLRTHSFAPRFELRAHRQDGTPMWVLASGKTSPFMGESCIVLTFQDVTEARQREQALTEANEQAERTNRARMRFLAAASHDLRQPLQALALFTSALDSHLHTPQARFIVQSMKTSLRGMEEMFDSLLDMSRLDAGVMKAEPQVFLIGDLFDRLETDYAPQAAAAGLDLRIVGSSAAVRSDPRMLLRILGNFLSNAIRYTRSGRVVIGCKLAGRNVKVMVCDTGQGIPDSQRLEIFKEFRQGDAATVAGRGIGVGLGLAIVQRLALMLNHRLDVRSIEGRGTAFSVEVPMAEEWLPQPPDPEDGKELRLLEGATIAVVDDDPDIQDGLKLLLGDWGCQAIVGPTAEAVVAELSESGCRPDLILADLHLRNRGSGIAAINTIRDYTGTCIPAFLFTGDTETPCGPASPPDYPVLHKPLDPLRLRTVVADALGR